MSEKPIVKYSELISVIPKIPTERLLQLIAFMKLELQLREAYKKNDDV